MYAWPTERSTSSEPVGEWRMSPVADDAQEADDWTTTPPKDTNGGDWSFQYVASPTDTLGSGLQSPPPSAPTQKPSAPGSFLGSEDASSSPSQRTSYVPEPPAFPVKLKSRPSTQSDLLSEGSISPALTHVPLSPDNLVPSPPTTVRTTTETHSTSMTEQIVSSAVGIETEKIETSEDLIESVQVQVKHPGRPNMNELSSLGLSESDVPTATPSTELEAGSLSDPSNPSGIECCSADTLADALQEILRLEDKLKDVDSELADARKQLESEKRDTARLRAEMEEDKAMLVGVDVLRQRVVELEADAEARSTATIESMPRALEEVSVQHRQQLSKALKAEAVANEHLATLRRQFIDLQLERDELHDKLEGLKDENKVLKERVQDSEAVIKTDRAQRLQAYGESKRPVYSRESLLEIASLSPTGSQQVDLTHAPAEMLKPNEPLRSDLADQWRSKAKPVGGGEELSLGRPTMSPFGAAVSPGRKFEPLPKIDKPLSPPSSPETDRGKVMAEILRRTSDSQPTSASEQLKRVSTGFEQGCKSSEQPTPSFPETGWTATGESTEVLKPQEESALSQEAVSQHSRIEQSAKPPQKHPSDEINLMQFDKNGHTERAAGDNKSDTSEHEDSFVEATESAEWATHPTSEQANQEAVAHVAPSAAPASQHTLGLSSLVGGWLVSGSQATSDDEEL
ncbi:hypothetical protein OIV83_005575 [Microbotryomycetes sp. JL201]|nr:hypothetical protein OIV83_005575 [Microbotryomycetes sp. JL201]